MLALASVFIGSATTAEAHSYYNLTGVGIPLPNTAGDTAIGFGIANSINGTDGVSNDSNGTSRFANGTNTYNPAFPSRNSLIPGTGTAASSIVNPYSPSGTEIEVPGNLPYMWYSGMHTYATGVTKRELFTGSSVTDTTGNLINISGSGNGNTLILPGGNGSITAPPTASWGTNNVASLWNAYNAKNTGGNAATWGTIMADLPGDGDHPYQAVAGNSAEGSGQGLDYGLIHVACGANSAADNCSSQGDLLVTISLKADTDYPQYTGLLDVALYRGVDTSLTTNRNAAYTFGSANPQGSSLGSPFWTASATSTSDVLFYSFVFNQAEWAATGTNVNSNYHTNGFYTLIIGAHGGSATDGVAYDILVTTSPVPVPAAVWLFGSALAGIGVIGRRRRTAA